MALTDKLSAIGAAIREKTGKSELLTLDAMPIEIASITTGSGSEDCNGIHIPEEKLNFSGNCNHRFCENGWNWFIKEFGDKITTSNLTNISHMFVDSNELITIPFELNPSTGTYIPTVGLFSGCGKLETLPKVNNLKVSGVSDMFSGCSNLREIPEDYFDTWDWSNVSNKTSTYDGPMGSMFTNCVSLRSIPDNLLTQEHINKYVSYSNSIYNKSFNNCYVIDKIKLPVYDKAKWTGNAFSSWTNLSRLSSLTFNTKTDGTPIVVTGSWKKQTLDLSTYVGYANNAMYIKGYNSGITDASRVYNGEEYAANKDNPDYWTIDVAYSRYNHDSAVETINTLPDVTSGSGNTIKFKGASGGLTDGGAINTLTSEEIAVAAAKGWTVTLV